MKVKGKNSEVEYNESSEDGDWDSTLNEMVKEEEGLVPRDAEGCGCENAAKETEEAKKRREKKEVVEDMGEA